MVPRGGRTFLATTRIRSREWEKKRANEQTRTICLGLTQEQKGSMQHYISDSIYGLTLAWITSENSTKQLEFRHLLTRSSLTVAGPSLMLARLSARVSGVDCPCPYPITNCLELLFPTNSLFASRYHFRIRWDLRSKNPLSGFGPKQTKESSAWRATHIVLQQYFEAFDSIKKYKWYCQQLWLININTCSYCHACK